MSHEKSLFVIVEGKVNDPRFADKICMSSQVIAKAGYEIRSITQVESAPGSYTGGKSAVLDLFDYYKSTGKLSQRNSSGWKKIAFIVDRDAQHLTGGRRCSRHVIYTKYADCEAHIFFNSNEVEALALAASIDNNEAIELKAFLGDWCNGLANDWRQWIELCYVGEAARSRTPLVGLGKARSMIHDGPRYRTIDPGKLTNARQAVEATSLYSAQQFQQIRALILGKIDRIYKRGRGFTLLKGKWLPAQLTSLVKDFFSNPSGADYDWNQTGFKESATRCYAAYLNTDRPATRDMKLKLEALILMHANGRS